MTDNSDPGAWMAVAYVIQQTGESPYRYRLVDDGDEGVTLVYEEPHRVEGEGASHVVWPEQARFEIKGTDAELELIHKALGEVIKFRAKRAATP